MSGFSNKLSKAAAERLACLVEEGCEVGQIGCKTLRHGYDSQHPDRPGQDNRDHTAKEVGDLLAVAQVMMLAGDLDPVAVAQAAVHKIGSLEQYTHHQPNRLLVKARERLADALLVARRAEAER